MRLAALLACLGSACTHVPFQDRQPALLVAPPAAARNELHEVVSTALNNPKLMLAEDALTHEHLLIVERLPRRDAAGVLLDGRELGMPERFLLFVEGAGCVLVRERTGQHWYLRHAHCKPDMPRAVQ